MLEPLEGGAAMWGVFRRAIGSNAQRANIEFWFPEVIFVGQTTVVRWIACCLLAKASTVRAHW